MSQSDEEEDEYRKKHLWNDIKSQDEIERMTDAEVLQYHVKMREKGVRASHGLEQHQRGKDDPAALIKGMPRVTKLFTKENWQQLGDTISNDTELIDLNLQNCGLTEEWIQAVFGFDEDRKHYSCQLEMIDMSYNKFGSAGVATLLPFLKQQVRIEGINLTKSGMESSGAVLVSEAMEHLRIKWLLLGENPIGGVGVGSVLSATNSIHLLHLNLLGIEIGRHGFLAISSFLGRDDISLSKFSVNCYNGEYAKWVVDTLTPDRSKLEIIELRDSRKGKDPLLQVYTNVLRLMCNTTSFESLCQSNHKLMWELDEQFDSVVHDFLFKPHTFTLNNVLQINARGKDGASANQRLRSKLRKFYFQGDFDLQPFNKLDAKLMPNLLQLVTRTEATNDCRHWFDLCNGDLSSIYRLVRNCHCLPELFAFPSAEAAARQANVLEERIRKLMNEVEELRRSNAALPIKRAKPRDISS